MCALNPAKLETLHANGISAYDPESIQWDFGWHSGNAAVHEYVLEGLTRIASPSQTFREMSTSPSCYYASVKAR